MCTAGMNHMLICYTYSQSKIYFGKILECWIHVSIPIYRSCITPYIETASNNKLKAQCPLCRGEITKNELLEAAQCQEEDEDGRENKETDLFENVIVDVSSTKINAVLRQIEISRLKGIHKT